MFNFGGGGISSCSREVRKMQPDKTIKKTQTIFAAAADLLVVIYFYEVADKGRI